jgi:hypothetical protein
LTGSAAPNQHFASVTVVDSGEAAVIPDFRARRVLLTAPFALGAGMLLHSCRRGAAARAQPDAARWRPLLTYAAPGAPAVDVDQLYRLPPPAAAASAAELQELLRRQSGRSAADLRDCHAWDRGAVIRWNEIARDLVAQHRCDLLAASRIYALLSVAQHDACVGVYRNRRRYPRAAAARLPTEVKPAPDIADPGEGGYPCLHGAIAGASAAVLGQLFPGDLRRLENRAEEHGQSRVTLGASLPGEVEAGAALGQRVGAAVVQHRTGDGSERAATAEDEETPGGWTPIANRAPLGPGWSRVRPWVMADVTRFRAPPPPAVGSPAFKAALQEVRRVMDGRTQEQSRIAALWADGDGSYTPAGRWNKIAADLLARHGWNEALAARCLALLNMALMDAGIACWDAKFHYGLLRPWQADPGIITPVGKPNFPSYTSAHACFSGAGADLLSQLFPEQRGYLQAKAEEAAVSRLYGGIHYRFDADAGLSQGRQVAALVMRERAGQESAA